MKSQHFIKNNPLVGSQVPFCEVNGLEELRKYREIHQFNIPKVFDYSQEFLKLENINSIEPSIRDWRQFAKKLLLLHKIENDQFGYYEDNYIGDSVQKNSYTSNWGEFFYNNRLYFQVSQIKDRSIRTSLTLSLYKFRTNIIDNLNEHTPKASLLHGDLWIGNIMFSRKGAWLIDPALYYGDRETDLAMTHLFGGFPEEFYLSYHQQYPKNSGFEWRQSAYKLYHCLNHYNLFGDSYLRSVRQHFEKLITF